jgi:hypothetical protein
VSAVVLFDENETPVPIHEDNAKRVQIVFDSSMPVERKVLQAEYLSPARYRRNVSIDAAILKMKRDMPGLSLNEDGYKTILTSVKRRVEKVFR